MQLTQILGQRKLIKKSTCVTYKTKDGITEEIHNVVDEIQEILEEQVNYRERRNSF